MSSLHLRKIWKVSDTLLRRAREALPPPNKKSQIQFDRFDGHFREYLDHNEHELALDMLEEMGQLVPSRGGFWKDLERAARNMELEGRIPFFEEQFATAIRRISPAEQASGGSRGNRRD